MGSDRMMFFKVQLIELLKTKFHTGGAHFVYVVVKVNGRCILRDSVICVCYFDVEVDDFRSLRFVFLFWEL